MNLIVAVSSDWGIGRNNGLLFSLPKDMNYFKETTMGKTIILGRKTLDTFPGGKPLPGRNNVVLTRDPDFTREGFMVYHSIPDLLQYTTSIPSEDIMIIGGESIYRSFLPLCKKAYITKIDCSAPDADRFFPDLDKDPEWELASISEPVIDNGLTIRFCIYSRVTDR